MAFPATTIIDTFEREAIEHPVESSVWAIPSWCTDGGVVDETFQGWCPFEGVPAVNGLYHLGKQYTNGAVRLQLTHLAKESGQYVRLWVGLNVTTHTGIAVKLEETKEVGEAKYNLVLEQWSKGVATTLGKTTTSMVAGQEIGIAAEARAITAWQLSVSPTTPLISVGLRSPAGFVGLEGIGVNFRSQNFAVGEVAIAHPFAERLIAKMEPWNV